MKISKWIELDGKHKIKSWDELDCKYNKDFQILVLGNSLRIRAPIDDWSREIVSIDLYVVGKDKTLAILKLFGFDIEFEETPKLSKKEWHGVNWLSDNWWIARDMFLFAFQSEPIKRETGYVCGRANDDYIKLPNDLFPFITPDRAWSVKELRELEVEE
ncbi:MAG: hypothetical protein M0R38_12230 [Bacteroidia bacterium]|nr:hypothetical protein [Bacteroidia bacterium]